MMNFLKIISTLCIFIACLTVMLGKGVACEIGWGVPNNHFDNANESEVSLLWFVVGQLDLRSDLETLVAIRIRSSKTKNSWLWTNWVFGEKAIACQSPPCFGVSNFSKTTI